MAIQKKVRGHLRKKKGTNKKVRVRGHLRIKRIDNGKTLAGPYNLSGGGQILGVEDLANGVVDETFSGNGGKTPQGVEIDETNSNTFATTLAFMFFEEVDFTALNLDMRLDI